MNNRILIADDEEDVRSLVATNLKIAGFTPVEAPDGASALARIREAEPALVVLDLMMPGLSGVELCRILKGDPRMSRIPVIMLTAKARESDRIAGLEMGADDYITKPFSPRELVLRVQMVIRRRAGYDDADNTICIGDVRLDRERHVVQVRGKAIELTATEFKLLATLMETQGRVQSREKLLTGVWGYETAIDTRTVDIHVRRIREKLGRAASYIHTIRGFGYRMSGPEG
jgi:phosphate regulon transcriptional regulator PhoB